MTDDAKCPRCVSAGYNVGPEHSRWVEYECGSQGTGYIGRACATIAALRAERDRYRRALDEIAQTGADATTCRRLAMQALNHQEEA